MFLFFMGWLGVFFVPQQNKYLLMFSWFLIITGIILGIFNELDREVRRSNWSNEQVGIATIILILVWIGLLLILYYKIFPIIYPYFIP
jgi:hypothetical protein